MKWAIRVFSMLLLINVCHLSAGKIFKKGPEDALTTLARTGQARNCDLSGQDLRQVLQRLITSPGPRFYIKAYSWHLKMHFGPLGSPYLSMRPYRVDLSGANLDGADLSGLDLTWVNLANTSCKGTNFSNSRFARRKVFWLINGGIYLGDKANLDNVNLAEAQLNGALLSKYQIVENVGADLESTPPGYDINIKNLDEIKSTYGIDVVYLNKR